MAALALYAAIRSTIDGTPESSRATKADGVAGQALDVELATDANERIEGPGVGGVLPCSGLATVTTGTNLGSPVLAGSAVRRFGPRTGQGDGQGSHIAFIVVDDGGCGWRLG